ncbi:MAG: B12-binding domain-containing radical SAM protein [Bacteroidota bacterium]
MNILLVNPVFPDTFWGFRHALKFVSKKAAYPPLGLLTVAALLPSSWNKKLVDMNVQELKESDLLWADYVFLGGMSVQRKSAREIIDRCKSLGKKIVGGGPLFTVHHEEYDDVDYLVLNEAELTLPRFIEDLSAGTPRHLYETDEWADVTTTPVPLWHLINPRVYGSLNLQYSRGCPYDCEFCDITVLYGRIPRTKTKDQLLAELEALYTFGWRGGVFFVDDNFIGNKNKLKKEVLPAVIEWMEEKRYPFSFNTEASVNLSDDEELMELMSKAGFRTVFVGIESPHEESLVECKKIPNRNRDLIASVRTIQQHGFQVQGGFIVGFDSDPGSIFQKVIDFVQESGIVTAMVGLLNAPVGTRLYQRLLKEGRLLKTMTGDNTDFSMNFIPRMNRDVLIKGYRSLLEHIYAPKPYYARVKQFLRTYKPPKVRFGLLSFAEMRAFASSTVLLGIVGKERVQYWKLLLWSLFTRPRLFPLAITFSIYGYHFRRILEVYTAG